MGRIKKDSNIEIGERLKVIRQNLVISQAEFAEILNVSDEHYRKLESGSTGLTIDKVRVLYEKCNIDPSWLLVGKPIEEFDLDKYLVNCSKEQRDELLKRCWNYIGVNIMKIY
ncbi:MAG TPA: helix-turn-helix transcriptional regulator [Lachnospiraceae bacterium]|nr:helix-turn-helix transcriptional regulator [Lachnospiraceae bacterium]